ncbi:MAG TPA: hypothetical protein VKB76_13505, partial [Ktedonobacterales bacterium]|nr:hypothetical protein [Ktedonobacterales bacterium]
MCPDNIHDRHINPIAMTMHSIRLNSIDLPDPIGFDKEHLLIANGGVAAIGSTDGELDFIIGVVAIFMIGEIWAALHKRIAPDHRDGGPIERFDEVGGKISLTADLLLE